jgi:hypothetical protein
MTIRDVLVELRIPFVDPGGHSHVTSNFFGVDCIHCSPNSGKYKLGIAVNGRGAHCWTCGRMNITEVLSTLSNRPYREISRLLTGVGLDLTRAVRTPPSGILVKPRGIGPLLGPHRRYLERRGFDPDWISEHYGVQGIGLAANLAWSIYIPIHQNKREVSWTTRGLTAAGRRYWAASPEEEVVSRRNLLYGADYARHGVIVVEGVFDAMRIGDGAVATFGSGYSQAQVALIASYPRRIIVLDNEPDAKLQAIRLANNLESLPGRTLRVGLTTGKDPAEASEGEIRELRKLLD